MKDETKEQLVERLELEARCREIGDMLRDICPDGVGFAFLLYNFGAEGNMAYTGNGDRNDFICAIKELVAILEGRSPKSSEVAQ